MPVFHSEVLQCNCSVSVQKHDFAFGRGSVVATTVAAESLLTFYIMNSSATPFSCNRSLKENLLRQAKFRDVGTI